MIQEKSLSDWMNTLRPELEIILLCVRPQIDSEAKNRIRTLLINGLNFDDIVASAIHNGVLPVMHESITAISPDLISPAQRQLLNDSVRATAANAMGLAGELVRVYRQFEAAGIPVVPYKGPVLATLAYGNVARRDYSDLDITVEQRYIPQAVAVLQAAGYLPQFDRREAHAGENGFAPGQYLFVLENHRVQVELHTERTLRYFPNPLDFQVLNRRLVEVEIAGQPIRTFSTEDTLVMLCVHGTKHFWERLQWILDVAKLISAREVDWVMLKRVAAEAKSSRVLLLGLSLSHDLLGASLPPDVLLEVKRDEQVQGLTRNVREQYEGAAGTGDGVGARALFRFRSCDTFGQGLRQMLRLTMSPTESDRQMVRLPRLLTPLYVLVRPWRLVREHGLGLKRRLKPAHKAEK
jgi:Uncharacterised nucleotidyltransferase